MAIKKSFNAQTIYKPGAYSKFKVDNSAGADLGSNDTVFLLGESTKGAPGSTTGILEFNASRLDAMIALFGEGPIVDAAIAATRPSNTPGVGGAGRILVWKTNATTQASNSLVQGGDTQYTVKDRAYGEGGNLLSVVVAAGTTADQKQISVTQVGGTTEALGENAAANILRIEYTGDATTAVVDIAGATRAALTLTTTLAGDQTDGSADLSIPLAGKTMTQLIEIINAATGYTASLQAPTQAAKIAIELDPVAAQDITTALDLKRIQLEVLELLNTSARIEAVEVDIVGGIVDTQTVDLTGGAKGASANTDFSTGMANSLANDYNVMLPCISRDAADDIADVKLGFTDGASAYTLTSVLAAMSSHLTLRGSTKNRKEAQGMGGVREATKAAAFTTIAAVNDANIQLTMQDVVFNDATGTNKVGQPHVLAAMMAGIRLGTDVGEPLTYKFVRSSLVGHILDPDTLLEAGDFNSGLDADEAIINGVTFVERRGAGYRVVVDNTTFGQDESFVFNRGSVLEASYFTMKTIRELAESLFVGKKVSNGLAQSVKNAIRNKLRELNQPEVQILTSSADAPEGFKEETFVVTVQGNTVNVQVEIKPVQAVDFFFVSFTLGDIQQTA